MEKAKTSFQGIYGMMWEKPAIRVSEFEAGKTALVVIDMINGYVKEGIKKNDLAEDIVEPVTDLMKYFRENSMPIVCFGDALRDEKEADLVDEIKAVGGYTYIAKGSENGFIEEEFSQWLKANPDITDFIITGISTDISVMQFALTLKAWFNKEKRPSRIVLPLNAAESYDNEKEGHNITLTNTMAVYFMEQMGIEVVFEINVTNVFPTQIFEVQ